MRKIFDGGDLKIYQVKNLKSTLVSTENLKVVVSDDEVEMSNVERIDIHIIAGEPMYYTIKQYAIFKRIIKKLKSIVKK